MAKTETEKAKCNEEETGDVSKLQSLRRSSRKRAIPGSSNEPKETSKKTKRYNSTATSALSEANEETESHTGIQKRDSSTKKMKSIDDLPSEMLVAVLQNVSTSDLPNCRLLNRKFNEITSRIMRQRADISLHFSFINDAVDGKFIRIVQHRCCEELLVNICESYSMFTIKSLSDLVVCLKESKHFPITNFKFDRLDQFVNDDMRSFLSIWGRNIFTLNVLLEDPLNNVGILRDLLVEKVSNLTKLDIHFQPRRDSVSSSIELSIDSNEFQLPKLQVLCVDRSYRQYRGIIGNILKAACNLRSFVYCIEKQQPPLTFWRFGIDDDYLAMLESHNKLHCLKNVRMHLTEDLIAFWATKRIDLKLEALALSFGKSIWKNDQLRSSVTAILNQWFDSSKDVMQTLSVIALGSLPGLHIPKFKRLRKLDLYVHPIKDSQIIDMFPPLFQLADNFPNLKDLGLNSQRMEAVDFFLPSQPLKPMPSIAVLRINGHLSSECEENLMKATPNVTTLLIEDTNRDLVEQQRVSLSIQTIANYLPKLQSIGWSISAYTHRDLLQSLDPLVTGFPVQFCVQNAEKFRNRDSLSADEVASYQLQQRNSSLLDLKELRQFDVNFLMEGSDDDYEECDCGDYPDCQCERFVEKNDESGFGPGDILYETGFTKVSKFLAFDLMPNLKVRTHKYLN